MKKYELVETFTFVLYDNVSVTKSTKIADLGRMVPKHFIVPCNDPENKYSNGECTDGYSDGTHSEYCFCFDNLLDCYTHCQFNKTRWSEINIDRLDEADKLLAQQILNKIAEPNNCFPQQLSKTI